MKANIKAIVSPYKIRGQLPKVLIVFKNFNLKKPEISTLTALNNLVLFCAMVKYIV